LTAVTAVSKAQIDDGVFRRVAFGLGDAFGNRFGCFDLKAARFHRARQAPEERAVVIDDQQARIRTDMVLGG
jgi:hypothetical protein